MLQYPARFEPDRESGGFVVTFPDFGWGVTQGDTAEEAHQMAVDLLGILISDCIGRKEDIPKPGRLRGKHVRPIGLPALQDAKVALYGAVRESGIRQAELSRRIGIPKTNVNRLFDLHHRSRLDLIEAGLRAVGKELVVAVRDAA